MAEIISLSSGSQGNCTVLKHQEELILIDCGISFKKLREKLSEVDLHEEMIKAIFITHEHGDHISGVKVTANKMEIPVYTNQNTGAFIRRKNRAPENLIFFENGTPINVNEFQVEPFSIPHDGVDTVAYNVFVGGRKFGVATDFGFASQMVKQKLKDCDALFLECNYDPQMLMQCAKRPWRIKQRILSRHGHLSNESCFEILTEVLHKDMSQLVLGHVSQDTNDYSLVKDLAEKHLEECGMAEVPLHVATQNDVSPIFKI